MSQSGNEREIYRNAFQKKVSQGLQSLEPKRKVRFSQLQYSSSEQSSVNLGPALPQEQESAPSRELSPQARVIRKSLKTHEEDKLGSLEDYDKDLAQELERRFSLASRCRIVSFQCGNFKTYAQNSRVFKLGASTAILGPNGSGKSNLADAVCFALGLEGNQIRGEGGNLHLMNGMVARQAQKEIARLIFQQQSPLPEKYGKKELMEIQIHLPWNLEKITRPIGFTKIEVKFRQDPNQKERSQELESAAVIREFELKVGCASLDLARSKKRNLDQRFELSYSSIVSRCIQVEERYKLQLNGGDIKQVSKEVYHTFLSQEMNIEAGMKSFVVMQHDLNPADFNCKKHSEIIERISGASKFSTLFLVETKIFAKQVLEYQQLKVVSKGLEKRMYHAQLQGKEKQKLLLVRRNLEESSLKLLFYRLFQIDVEIQEQCQRLVKSGRALDKEKGIKEKEYRKLENLEQVKIVKETDIGKMRALANSKKEVKSAQLREREQNVKVWKEKLEQAQQGEKDYLAEQESRNRQKERAMKELKSMDEREEELAKDQEFLHQPHVQKGLKLFREFLQKKKESSFGAFVEKEALDGIRAEYERAMRNYEKLEKEMKNELAELINEIKGCFDREHEGQIKRKFQNAEAALDQAKKKFQQSDQKLQQLEKEADQIQFILDERNASENAKISNNFLYREIKEARERVDGIIGTMAEAIAPKRVLYLKPLVRALGHSVNHILVKDEEALLATLKIMKQRKVRCTLINLEEKSRKAKEHDKLIMHKNLKDQSLDNLLGKLGLRFTKIVRANPSLATKKEFRNQIEQYINYRFNRHILAFSEEGAIDLQATIADRKIISLSGGMQSYDAFYELNNSSIITMGKLQAEKMLSSLIEATKEKGKKKYMIKLHPQHAVGEEDEEQQIKEEEHKIEIETLQELGIAVAQRQAKINPLEQYSDKELKEKQDEIEAKIKTMKEGIEMQKKLVMQKQESYNDFERELFKLHTEKTSKAQIMEHLEKRIQKLEISLKELDAARLEKQRDLEEQEARHKLAKDGFKYTNKEQEQLEQIGRMLGIKGKKREAEELIETIERDYLKRQDRIAEEVNEIEAKKEKLLKLIESLNGAEKRPEIEHQIRDLKLKIKNNTDMEDFERINEEISRIEVKVDKEQTELDQLIAGIAQLKRTISDLQKAETTAMQTGSEAKRELLANLQQKSDLQRELKYEMSVAQERRNELDQLQNLLNVEDTPKKREGRSPAKRQKRGKYLKERRDIKRVKDILAEQGMDQDRMEDAIIDEKRVNYADISRRLNIREDILKLQYYALQNMISVASEAEKRWKREFERVRFEIEVAKREPKQELGNLRNEYAATKKHQEQILAEIMKRKESIEEIRKQHRTRFLSCFKHISAVIHDIYYDLTKEGNLPGGSINLYAQFQELVHQSIVYLPTPPGKGATINSGELSSGELSIATIAFILAAHSYRPSAILIFDEIDQYLDPMAMARLCTWMENRKLKSDHFQWLLVTHKFNSAILSSSIISIGIIFKPLFKLVNGEEKVVSEGKMSSTLHYNTTDYMSSGSADRKSGGGKTHEQGFLNFQRISELVSRKHEALDKHAKLLKAIRPLN